MGIVHSEKLMQAWSEAGVIDNLNTVRRIVLDLRVGEAPVMYVERYADGRLLSVTPTLEGIEISRDPDLAEAPSD